MVKSRPKLISTPEITDVTLRDDVFLVTIQGFANDSGGLGKLGATHAFPLEDLRKGASLSRMMTLSMRMFLKQDKCGDLTAEQRGAFRKLSVEAVMTLRPMVERTINREDAARLGIFGALKATLDGATT